MFDNWRIYVIVALLILSIVDLSLTYFYVTKYKSWQPNKAYNLMERNPLLVFLWKHLGLHFGMLVGSTIILALVYIIAREAHWIIVLLLAVIMLATMINHFHNLPLLYKLIEKYPAGHLPEEIFGKVEGNN